MGDWFTRNRHRYGPDWDQISKRTREAAGGRCEACGIESGYRHILTVDHLNHDPTDHRPENLIALCQRDHLRRQGLRPRPATRADAIARLRERIARDEAAAAAQGKLWGQP